MNDLTLDNIQIEHGPKLGEVTLRHEGLLLAHRAYLHAGWSFMNAPTFTKQDLTALVFTILTKVP